MTKAALKQLDTDLQSRRKQVRQLREELVDLGDYLDVLDARLASAGKPRLTQAEAVRRYAAPAKVDPAAV